MNLKIGTHDFQAKLSLFDLLDADEGEKQLLQNRNHTLDTCTYYSPISLPTQHNYLKTSNTFQLLLHNVRSLVKNGETFKDFLSNANILPSTILVTETWLRDCVPPTVIPNYSFYGKNREGKMGGGVGIFVHNKNNCIERLDLIRNSAAMEHVSVELDRNSDINIIVSCIYRPPDTNFNQFITELQILLQKLSTCKN